MWMRNLPTNDFIARGRRVTINRARQHYLAVTACFTCTWTVCSFVSSSFAR